MRTLLLIDTHYSIERKNSLASFLQSGRPDSARGNRLTRHLMTGSTYYNVEKAVAWRSGGSTQAEARVYNERLILSLIRLHGQLSKVELTRLTGLSPQTITSIVDLAATNQLLVRGNPRRGGLGQPSVPYALNPAGAWALGLAFDADGCNLVLSNFIGEVVELIHLPVSPLMPMVVVEAVAEEVRTLLGRHPHITVARMAGLGIASPFHGESWPERLRLTRDQADAWNQVDLRAELDARFDWPVYLLAEALVAAGAELTFGAGLGRPDFLYIHIGMRISCGLVLDHHLYLGRNKQAGMVDVGTVALNGTDSPAENLNGIASLNALSARTGAGTDILLHADPTLLLQPEIAAWIDDASRAVAGFAWQMVNLLDIDNIIVGGDISQTARKALARSLRRDLSQAATARMEPLTILDGRFGPLAFALGGASIPLLVRFGRDKDLLFK